MTDYVVTNGKSSAYPANHYGAHFTGSRATFCLPQDLATFDANVQAIPNLPVSAITTSPVTAGSKFLGLHIKYLENYNQSECPAGSIRLHDLANGKARWQFIQPTSNPDTTTWDWADLDAAVNAHYAAGRDIVFTLFGTPSWASARPTEDTVGLQNAYSDYVAGVWYNRGIAAEPSDMTKWDAFCTAVATRYLGKIKYYEVWNEANYSNDGTGPTGTSFFFSGTFAKLSEMTRRANQAIKAVDPTAKILCCPTTAWASTAGGTAEAYFTSMMAASSGDVGTTPMKNWIDIVAVHLYIAGNDITKMAGMIDRVKAGMSTAGVTGKEIWDTESAPIAPVVSNMTLDAAKLFIARSMMIQAAKGISRTFYFQYDDTTMGVKGISQVTTFREQARTILQGGSVLALAGFTDGRVAYTTSTGVISV